ncbi:MAG: rhodanese-like domain-containing protein [Candidatus Melainabacteria bacterium]|nr:rhodanese-like domain-containing protein [Candidatus Melainabacteria bacterium]MBI3307982.1 rhodanese-like domain-containing protein [Candidatus Melainabacteria bacterium]
MKKKLCILLCGLFIVFNVSCSPALKLNEIDTQINKFLDITHAELLEVIKNKKAFIIDANGSKSYNTGHIPGAIDYAVYNGEELKSKLPENKQQLVVCYCGSPKCPAWYKAASEVESYGYENIKHYKKGIKGWIKKGGPLEE